MRYSYVYMMANKTNTTLYIGVTSNLLRRVYEHREKLVSGFTEKYNLNKLVFFEVFEDINEAIKREKALKNLVRRKKNLLIEKENPTWGDLYQHIV
ncbi:MAG: GIY-YIG nuclease family protein [Candidatus Daviesbacteria bacterium]|nr:GIY-YIG nuclease family protein [Candidatus Daviesbacteria bacterium]